MRAVCPVTRTMTGGHELMKQYWIYMLECENGSYYTGYTDDLARRYREHRAGSARSRYTRSFKPLRIACCWKVDADRGQAMSVESFIKSQARNVKEAIVENPGILARLLKSERGESPALEAVDPGTIETGPRVTGTA